MDAKVIASNESSYTIQIEVKKFDSMLEAEEQLQRSLNDAGALGTQEIFKQFDTDGSSIQIGGFKLTSKGQEPKEYTHLNLL